MKKCPFCADDIQDSASVCKHCGHVQPRSKPNAAAGAIPGIVVEENLGQVRATDRTAATSRTQPAVSAPPRNSPLRIIGLVVGLLLLAVAVAVVLAPSTPPTASTKSLGTRSPSSEQSEPAATPQQSDDSLEYKLAVLNNGGAVAHNDITIARFRSLLGQLSVKFSETPERIGDMSAMARNQLAEKGVSESLLNIMDGMNQIVAGPGSYGKDPYANFLTLYIVLRASGKSHDFAINNLTGVVRELGLK